MGTYIRLAIVDIPTIIKLIKIGNGKKTKATIDGNTIGVCSTRLQTFARGARGTGNIVCCACGLQAKYFAIETFARGQEHSPHANLYGELNGKEVLFTHDHTLARSLGGVDNLSNTTVMCSPCNSLKSVSEGKESEYRRQLTQKEIQCQK